MYTTKTITYLAFRACGAYKVPKIDSYINGCKLDVEYEVPFP